MMRCRTGTAQALALSCSKLVAVPDQRRTASRTLRSETVQRLVHIADEMHQEHEIKKEMENELIQVKKVDDPMEIPKE